MLIAFLYTMTIINVVIAIGYLLYLAMKVTIITYYANNL